MSSFITTEATQDVFELVLARPVATHAGEHRRLVHLWWRATSQGNRLVQVYVQDELHDVTLDPAQREMFLLLDRTRPWRIELLAVPADDPVALWRAQPGLLKGWQPPVSDMAAVALVRDADLPAKTQVVVTLNGTQLQHGPMWPAAESTMGLGVGQGELGAGPLGDDGNAWRWRGDGLPTGANVLDFDAVDPTGQAVANRLTENIVIEALPQPVAGLSIDPDFRLSWSLP